MWVLDINLPGGQLPHVLCLGLSTFCLKQTNKPKQKRLCRCYTLTSFILRLWQPKCTYMRRFVVLTWRLRNRELVYHVTLWNTHNQHCNNDNVMCANLWFEFLDGKFLISKPIIYERKMWQHGGKFKLSTSIP